MRTAESWAVEIIALDQDADLGTAEVSRIVREIQAEARAAGYDEAKRECARIHRDARRPVAQAALAAGIANLLKCAEDWSADEQTLSAWVRHAKERHLARDPGRGGKEGA
jgi:hypothetical protein